MRVHLVTALFALACSASSQRAPEAAPAPADTAVEPAALAPSTAGTAGASSVSASSEDPAPDAPAPRTREYPWMSVETWWKMHRALLAIDPGVKRDSQLAFLGDSITEGWDHAAWNEAFGRYRPVRLGIGGDKTQQLLYRIDQGELDGLGSRLVVILIGTNNFGLGDSTSAGVAAGVRAVLSRVGEKLPKARVLLLGILPRDELPRTELRTKVSETNALLSKLASGDRVHYLDVGASFLDREGKIPAELMGDFLHPTPKGYRTFAAALTPKLEELLALPPL